MELIQYTHTYDKETKKLIKNMQRKHLKKLIDKTCKLKESI
jgi:hypothetical protein